jgi:hypothetical protein
MSDMNPADLGKVSDERIQDIINSYHGSIKAIALELQRRRSEDPPKVQRILVEEEMTVRELWAMDMPIRKFRLNDD